jgi:hypothetical protein
MLRGSYGWNRSGHANPSRDRLFACGAFHKLRAKTSRMFMYERQTQRRIRVHGSIFVCHAQGGAAAGFLASGFPEPPKKSRAAQVMGEVVADTSDGE